MNLLYWTTALGFFISMFVVLSFLLVFTIVASWIVLGHVVSAFFEESTKSDYHVKHNIFLLETIHDEIGP